jgi:hypothetical protein
MHTMQPPQQFANLTKNVKLQGLHPLLALKSSQVILSSAPAIFNNHGYGFHFSSSFASG